MAVTQYPAQVPQVVPVHQHDVVIILVVARRHLAGVFAAAVDAVGIQHAPRRRVHGITDFFGARRGTCHLKAIDSLTRELMLHDEFRHGASTDVAVANEENFHLFHGGKYSQSGLTFY